MQVQFHSHMMAAQISNPFDGISNQRPQCLMNDAFRPQLHTVTIKDFVILFQIGKGLLRSMKGDFFGTADLIPVDIATNLMIAVAWQTATQK